MQPVLPVRNALSHRVRSLVRRGCAAITAIQAEVAPSRRSTSGWPSSNVTHERQAALTSFQRVSRQACADLRRSA
jgi:hypothetical protein